MRVDPQQRATIVGRALAMGAAALKTHAAGAPAGPRMASTPRAAPPHRAQGPDTPQGSGVTAANADEVAAQLRDLTAWIGSRKATPGAPRTRTPAPTATRTATDRAPRTDDEKARAIASTWAALRARQQGDA